MTLIELKAQAYDCFANIEYWQKRLVETNKLIEAEAAKTAKEPVTLPDKA